ncbi:hypothetical protein PCL_10287 [Purpureocillium lilacinum]|uniref:Uncharacterized protein n=1 Tax=Purpureocillium lilacinum TaxID=33203 RepID=A0A2U3EFN4_PURLI|nr:hypothetical protein Purlil1_3827 [Purpureocillium lilacinum]PWI73272.1 hypothetical protein PCL_10287 [Purpureocillium lilacinum]
MADGEPGTWMTRHGGPSAATQEPAQEPARCSERGDRGSYFRITNGKPDAAFGRTARMGGVAVFEAVTAVLAEWDSPGGDSARWKEPEPPQGKSSRVSFPRQPESSIRQAQQP